MIYNTPTSKTVSIRYSNAMDNEVMGLIALSKKVHGVSPTRNKLLTAAIAIGLPVLLETYSKGEKQND